MRKANRPKASLIISNLNGRELVKECLRSLTRLEYPDYEIIVVDAGSTDGTPEMISKEFPSVRLLKEKRIGIGEAINRGIAAAEGDVIAFDLNNDEIFSRGWLAALVGELLVSGEKKVISGVRMIYGIGEKIDSAGRRVLYNGRVLNIGFQENIANLPKSPFEVSFVEAPVFRRELLDVAGLCDEKYYIFGEDWDFCERARKAGYKILTVPSAISYHRRAMTVERLGPKKRYYMSRSIFRVIIKHFPAKRMIIALATWFVGLIGSVVRDLIGLMLTRSREHGDDLIELLRGFLWSMENLRDHFSARREILTTTRQQIKA